MFKALKIRTGIRGEMAIVLAVIGLATLAMSLLSPVLPLYLTSIGIEPVLLGSMLSVAMIGMAIGEPGWGWLADRMGTQVAMIAGTCISGISVLLFVFTQNVLAIFGIFFLWGFLRSAVFGPGRGYIGTAAPPFKKATFMAFSAVMLSASRSLGALPSGFLVDSLGYHSVFYTSLGVSLVGGVIVLTGLRQRPVIAGKVQSEDASKSIMPPVKFNLFSITPQCAVTALRFLGMGSMMTFLPLLATQVIGVDVIMVGVLFTISGLVNVLLAVPMGMLADRFGKRAMMISGLAVSAGATVGIAFASSFAWLVIFVILNSIGMVMFSPAALGLLSESVPLHRQSTAMGFYGGVCENIGIIGGSALGGIIWDTWGPQPTFLIGALTIGLGAIICLVLVKNVH
jgi:MFS family permease